MQGLSNTMVLIHLNVAFTIVSSLVFVESSPVLNLASVTGSKIEDVSEITKNEKLSSTTTPSTFQKQISTSTTSKLLESNLKVLHSFSSTIPSMVTKIKINSRASLKKLENDGKTTIQSVFYRFQIGKITSIKFNEARIDDFFPSKFEDFKLQKNKSNKTNKSDVSRIKTTGSSENDTKIIPFQKHGHFRKSEKSMQHFNIHVPKRSKKFDQSVESFSVFKSSIQFATKLQDKINSLDCDIQSLSSDSTVWQGNKTHELNLPFTVRTIF